MLPVLSIAVPIGEIMADIGIGTIVTQGIQHVIKPQAKNLLHKACIFAGEAAITAAVCDQANDSIENSVEECIDMWRVWKENRSLIAVLAELEGNKDGKQE